MNLENIINFSSILTGQQKTHERKQLEFNFFKNTIQKDIDVVVWANGLCDFFRDVDIYSDKCLELNSIEDMITFITNTKINFDEDSLELEIMNRAYENLFCIIFAEKAKFKKLNSEQLAHDFTNYILEAIELKKYSREQSSKLLHELDLKYFGGRYVSSDRKVDSKYLN